MNRNLLKPLAGVFALAVGMLSTPVAAQLTGTIEAKLNLTSTCTINSIVFPVSGGSSTVTYTSLDFASTTTAFTQIDSSTSISYTCSQGSSPTITLGDGNNFASNSRHMKLGTTSHVVRYQLYTDAGRTSAVPGTGIISLSGNNTATTLNIYARAFGGTGLSTGNYTDLITVTLTL